LDYIVKDETVLANTSPPGFRCLFGMSFPWQTLKALPRILSAPAPDLEQQVARVRYMERNVGLPVRAAGVLLLAYYLFFSNWFGDFGGSGDVLPADIPAQEVALEVIRRYFLIYVVASVGFACMLLSMRQLPQSWVPRIVFASAWFDALFLSALIVVTGGADSPLYWVFLGFIVRNTVSTPVTSRQIILNLFVILCYIQIILNLFVILCYILSSLFEVRLEEWLARIDPEPQLAGEVVPSDVVAQGFLLRVFLLAIMTLCCSGVQILFDRERLAEEKRKMIEAEAREYAVRQQQLQTAGRLAAEIAHQLKNPLGIINNAAFTLQRTVKEGKKITQQIQIIREEVERSDRILTELMGYAQLSEGRVEKIDVAQELDRAVERVFPPGAKYEVKVTRDYAPALPPLLVQRNHISEMLVNLLQNSREAMDGKGSVQLSTRYGENYSVLITIRDDGPGIAPDKLGRIFEPYYTTKEKGTGLGLAIVKHNTEIYGGSVQVESELGYGTQFTIVLPAQTVMRLRK
jgi:signal transduction histidine kinase